MKNKPVFINEEGKTFLAIPYSENKTYQERMLLNIKSEYLLPVNIRHINNNTFFYYNLNSKKSLYVLSKQRGLKGNDIESLLISVKHVVKIMNEFLLNADHIVLDPEYIMQDSLSNIYTFCYCIDDEACNYKELAEFLIAHIDYEDERAKLLSYDYYNQVMEGITDPTFILQKYEENSEEKIQVLNEEIEEYDSFKEEYYFKEPDDEKEENHRQFIIKPLIISGVLITIIMCLYMYIYLNDGILTKLSIPQESYIIVGSGIAGILTICIVLIFYYAHGKYQKKREEQIDDEENEKAIIKGSQEWEEFCMSNEEEETVLLMQDNDYPCLCGSGLENTYKFIIDKNPFVIGKQASSVDGLVCEKGVSRVHAFIYTRDNKYYIKDYSSTNGIYLNGHRIATEQEIQISDMDEIGIGIVKFSFVDTNHQ